MKTSRNNGRDDGESGFGDFSSPPAYTVPSRIDGAASLLLSSMPYSESSGTRGEPPAEGVHDSRQAHAKPCDQAQGTQDRCAEIAADRSAHHGRGVTAAPR